MREQRRRTIPMARYCSELRVARTRSAHVFPATFAHAQRLLRCSVPYCPVSIDAASQVEAECSRKTADLHRFHMELR